MAAAAIWPTSAVHISAGRRSPPSLCLGRLAPSAVSSNDPTDRRTKSDGSKAEACRFKCGGHHFLFDSVPVCLRGHWARYRQEVRSTQSCANIHKIGWKGEQTRTPVETKHYLISSGHEYEMPLSPLLRRRPEGSFVFARYTSVEAAP